ncbi:hypothetical protein L1987_84877 [Smallanthus sonchifolius]|uniref:Uncharacterized protein n=1 Tax=Smallanthus sonchifolius TaxID=185202 RepID=A0ACB8XVL7_9ASTR|nr:hypothetical protein L1987_84877 [Smallanthus sonchifolius]
MQKECYWCRQYMTTTLSFQNNGFDDTGSINRPPRLVSGEDYDMWKNMMESFYCYQEYGMWRSIKDGPYAPMVASADSGCP